jgi:hypothetical protein
MKLINENVVFFIERNIRGGWAVYGMNGVKQYYGYSKSQAKKMYENEYKVIVNKES